VLVLDNVSTHDATVVRRWLALPAQARVRRRWLPTDRPPAPTPIERGWGRRTDAVAANRPAGSIDAWGGQADRCFARTPFTAPYPARDTTSLPAAA
jgi:hypothetical protein